MDGGSSEEDLRCDETLKEDYRSARYRCVVKNVVRYISSEPAIQM